MMTPVLGTLRNLLVCTLPTAFLVLGGCSSSSAPRDPAAFCAAVDALRISVDRLATGPETIEAVPAARGAADAVVRRARAVKATAPADLRDDAGELADATADVAARVRDFYDAVLDDPERAGDARALASFGITEGEQARLDVASRRLRPRIAQQCPPADTPPSTGAAPASTAGSPTTADGR